MTNPEEIETSSKEHRYVQDKTAIRGRCILAGHAMSNKSMKDVDKFLESHRAWCIIYVLRTPYYLSIRIHAKDALVWTSIVNNGNNTISGFSPSKNFPMGPT